MPVGAAVAEKVSQCDTSSLELIKKCHFLSGIF